MSKILIEPGIDTTKLVCIGQDITETLEAIPGRLFVKQYIRPRYVVPGTDGSTVIAAKMPERFIDKGIMGEGLLAQVVIDKYCDHMPLYRQARRFEREGVSLAESTLGDAVRQVANQAISPMFDLLVKQLLNCQYMQADETHIRVLAKDDANASTRGFYWVYYSPELKVADGKSKLHLQNGFSSGLIKFYGGWCCAPGPATISSNVLHQPCLPSRLFTTAGI